MYASSISGHSLFLPSEPKKFFHVTPFRPAHKSERVIVTLFFIGFIVPAGSVRTRESEIQLLHIVWRAWDGDADVAYEHDAGFVARYLAGELYRITACCRGRNDDRVSSMPASMRLYIGVETAC